MRAFACWICSISVCNSISSPRAQIIIGSIGFIHAVLGSEEFEELKERMRGELVLLISGVWLIDVFTYQTRRWGNYGGRERLVCSLATAILVAAASFDSLNETMRTLVNFYIEGKVTATLLWVLFNLVLEGLQLQQQLAQSFELSFD